MENSEESGNDSSSASEDNNDWMRSINNNQIQIINYNIMNNDFATTSHISRKNIKFYQEIIPCINFILYLVVFCFIFLTHRNSYSLKKSETETFSLIQFLNSDDETSHKNGPQGNNDNSKNLFSLISQKDDDDKYKRDYFCIYKMLYNKKKQIKRRNIISDINYSRRNNNHNLSIKKKSNKRILSVSLMNQYITKKEEQLRLKESVFRDLSRHSYYGIWNSNIKLKNFKYNYGDIRIIMYLSSNFRFKDIYLSYAIFLYDGKGKKNWIMFNNKIGMSLNNTKIERNNTTDKLEIKHNTILASSSNFKSFDLLEKNYLTLNFKYFLDKSVYYNITGEIYNIIDNSFSFSKEELKINFFISKERVSFFSKIASLSICMCIIGIIQAVNSKKLIENFQRNSNNAKNVFYLIYL